MLIFAKKNAVLGLTIVVVASLVAGANFVSATDHQINEPYLNEDYLEYLELPASEKAEVELVPEMFSLDVDDELVREATSGMGQDGFNDTVKADIVPSKFDLRDVDGKNYLTPQKDQGKTGICWAFSSVEAVESHVMYSAGSSFDANTVILSPRQLDYASSTNGIKDYNNENGMRKLLYGGNFFMSSLAMMNGISLIPESKMPFNDSQDQKELADVLNYDNSVYEVDETIMMPNFTDNSTFINYVKKRIMVAGAAYVATGSPQGSCAVRNTDGAYVILQEGDCENDVDFGAHAMNIIGWDDDYMYEYCKVGAHHYRAVDGNCGLGTYTSGTGAWIIRNSWGDDPVYGYVYLAYDSTGLDVSFVSGVSKMAEREWDNNYHHNIYDSQSPAHGANQSTSFTKKVSGSEKITKIKFMTLSMWRDYTISIKTKSATYDNVATFTVVWPGIYTVNLTDKNIILSDDSFTVNIRSADGGEVLDDSISVFTSNTNSAPAMTTKAVTVADNALEKGDISFRLYSDTKNIPSNAKVSYSLKKGNTDYSRYLKATNNTEAANNINTTITIDDAIEYGDYKIVASYGGKNFETSLPIKTTYKLSFANNSLIEEKSDTIIINSTSYKKLLSLVSANISNPVYTHYDKDKKTVTSDALKTGDTLEAKLGSKVKYSYVISVLGDIDGDGKVGSADYVKVRKHIMETEKIGAGLKFYAADTNKDQKISSADYIKIKKFIMNGGTL